MKKDKRIDEYIAKSQDFAKPILKHLRELVHQACPDVEETIKWGFPNFMYKGILCSMASFKQHCAFGFWKGSLIPEISDKNPEMSATSMGHFGKLTSLDDLLPDKKIIALIKKAMKLNDEDVKLPQRIPVKKGSKTLEVPEFILKAIAKNKTAKSTFENFSYSHKKEYVEWITEAKTETTRQKRLKTTIEWLSEGKGRNWKYGEK